jgi:hypothetical protein
MRLLELGTGAILIAVFATFATANVVYARRRRSLAPLIGGVSGLVGFASIAPLRPFCWLPLIADLGTLVVPCAAIVHEWRRIKRRS